uniref:Uncharacterized protein n=1 Tax=Equus asinus TaxID=9793 RepID=A0A9L0K7C7_EQUAS
MNVLTVGRPSPGSHSSSSIREHILERNPINAVNAEKPSVRNHISLDIREFTQERNLMYALNVGKPSLRSPTSQDISEFIQERNLTYVLNVEKKPFLRSQTLLYIREFILGGSPIDVLYVKSLHPEVTTIHQRIHTVVKS